MKTYYNIPILIILIALQVIVNFKTQAQQQDQIDSLKQLLQNATISIEDRTAIQLKISKLNRRSQPKEHLEYAQKALAGAQASGDRKTQGIALCEIASYYHKADLYDSSIYYYQNAIPYFISERNIGNTYSRLSKTRIGKCDRE
jgi:hypothetical protein